MIKACDSIADNDCRISNARSASYTPVAGDVDEELTARVTYADGEAAIRAQK